MIDSSNKAMASCNLMMKFFDVARLLIYWEDENTLDCDFAIPDFDSLPCAISEMNGKPFCGDRRGRDFGFGAVIDLDDTFSEYLTELPLDGLALRDWVVRSLDVGNELSTWHLSSG
jgi:hypothetical protein